MNFNVPQYIDIEDRIAFRLTAKQLGWFGLGGFVLFIVWNVVTKGWFIFWAVIVALICSAFAFYRPNGASLFTFLMQGVGFLFKPKLMVWRKQKEKEKKFKEKPTYKKRTEKINRVMKEKTLKSSDELASILDTKSRL